MSLNKFFKNTQQNVNVEIEENNFEEEKILAPYDFIRYLTILKTPWEEISVENRKQFQPFMINRFLSMNPNMVILVNELQKYTIGVLQPYQVYNMYLKFLPKREIPLNYVKIIKDEKYNIELVQIFSEYFKENTNNVKNYLEILFRDNEGVHEIVKILKKYGKDDKKIQELIKINK